MALGKTNDRISVVNLPLPYCSSEIALLQAACEVRFGRTFAWRSHCAPRPKRGKGSRRRHTRGTMRTRRTTCLRTGTTTAHQRRSGSSSQRRRSAGRRSDSESRAHAAAHSPDDLPLKHTRPKAARHSGAGGGTPEDREAEDAGASAAEPQCAVADPSPTTTQGGAHHAARRRRLCAEDTLARRYPAHTHTPPGAEATRADVRGRHRERGPRHASGQHHRDSSGVEHA